jgi:hypothetical protein
MEAGGVETGGSEKPPAAGAFMNERAAFVNNAG